MIRFFQERTKTTTITLLQSKKSEEHLEFLTKLMTHRFPVPVITHGPFSG